jgi:hypothetical protein
MYLTDLFTYKIDKQNALTFLDGALQSELARYAVGPTWLETRPTLLLDRALVVC